MWLRILTQAGGPPFIAMGITLSSLLLLLLLGFLGLRFKLVFTSLMLVFRWLRWYFVGSVGISLVVIPSLNVDGK